MEAMFYLLVMYLLGVLISDKFNIKELGLKFSLPVGMVAFFGIYQFIEYPLELIGLNVNYIHLMTGLYIVGILVYSIFKRKLILNNINELKHKKILLFLGLLIAVIYCVLFSNTYLDLRTDDANFYIPYINNNVYGALKYVRSQYDFQSIFNFQSFIVFVFEKISFLPNYTTIIPFGIIVNLPSIIFYFVFGIALVDIYNFIDYNFAVKKYIKIIVIISVLLFIFSMYWYLAHAYYGNTYRRVAVIYLFYFIYKYHKDISLKNAILLLITFNSLLAMTSTGLFLGIMMLYVLFIILSNENTKGYLTHLMIMGLPLIYYGVIFKPVYGVLLYIYLGIFIISLFTDKIEWLLNKISYFIMFAVPLVFVLIANLDGLKQSVGYSFFGEHSFDMVFRFLYFNFSSFKEIILALFVLITWISLFVSFKYILDKKSDFYLFGYIAFILILTFFNPLVYYGVFAKLTYVVYFRIYDIIFNPLTQVIFLLGLINLFNYKYKKIVVVVILIIFGYRSSINYISQYFQEKDLNNIYHVSNSDLDILDQLQEYIRLTEVDGKVASQVYSIKLLTDGNMSNSVSLRIDDLDALYMKDDVDSIFLQIFHRRLYNDVKREEPLSRVCEVTQKKDIQYVIVETQYNWIIEDGLGYCGEVILNNDRYRVYNMRYDWLD
jgi:hypothetical protein